MWKVEKAKNCREHFWQCFGLARADLMVSRQTRVYRIAWCSEWVCSELSMLCHPSAAQARTELLKWFSVLPPLPCFYWPRWMLQRGNQMWDRDDLKGQVINIICLSFLILMGWCLRCWPQGGGKHDPLDLKWEQSKGFQAWESSATPVKCLILCVCMWTLSGNSLFQQQVLLTFFPLSKSTNAIFILDVSFSF